MENIEEPLPQWTEFEPTFRFISYVLLAVLLTKAYLGARPSVLLHPTALNLVVDSLLVYGLASRIYAVSRGRIHVIARWVTAISACVMVATMTYLAYV